MTPSLLMFDMWLKISLNPQNGRPISWVFCCYWFRPPNAKYVHCIVKTFSAVLFASFTFQGVVWVKEKLFKDFLKKNGTKVHLSIQLLRYVLTTNVHCIQHNIPTICYIIVLSTSQLAFVESTTATILFYVCPNGRNRCQTLLWLSCLPWIYCHSQHQEWRRWHWRRITQFNGTVFISQLDAESS